MRSIAGCLNSRVEGFRSPMVRATVSKVTAVTKRSANTRRTKAMTAMTAMTAIVRAGNTQLTVNTVMALRIPVITTAQSKKRTITAVSTLRRSPRTWNSTATMTMRNTANTATAGQTGTEHTETRKRPRTMPATSIAPSTADTRRTMAMTVTTCMAVTPGTTWA